MTAPTLARQQKMSEITTQLQSLLDKQISKSNTHGVLLGVQSGDGKIDFEGAAGTARADQPFFMASITKMFTATLLMQLVDEGQVQLDDKVTSHLKHIDLKGVHTYRGKDWTDQLTVRHLVHQTSGLADFFEDSFLEKFKRGDDFAYNLTDVLPVVRGMKAQFAPNNTRSFYSDTNYLLLGTVIKSVTGKDLPSLFKTRIFEPLGMCDTFVFDHTQSHNYPALVPFYNKSLRLDLPLALSCMAADGGGVWTLTDGLRFLRAYFAGALFNPSNLDDMQNWNSMFFPFQYGLGLMRYKLPRWINLFRETTEFIGHTGVIGSWAFYAPKEDIYLVGSFNQIDSPQRPCRFMPRVMDLIKNGIY